MKGLEEGLELESRAVGLKMRSNCTALTSQEMLNLKAITLPKASLVLAFVPAG